MPHLGNVNNRAINYIRYDTKRAGFDHFPEKNWLLFVITENYEREIFDEIIRRAIERNVCYICSTGKVYDKFEDDADEIIVLRDVENEYLPKHHIITTGQENISEEFWFAAMAAGTEHEKIEQIVCLDLRAEANIAELEELTGKINMGWIPES